MNMPPYPADLGYAMPAEWLPHQATWLSWPHNRASWPGAFEHVEPVMVAAVRALAGSETVRINVLDAAHEAHVRALLEAGGVAMDAVVLHRFPTDDAWCRDHGALFVTRQGSEPLAAVDCRFNAWGGKYPPWDRDDAIGRRMAETLDVPRFVADLVLEGGAVDVNGAGAVLTSEQCLLHPNRNPQLSRADVEQWLRRLLGVEQVLWLGEGIAGDDTDGHVDDMARFVSRDTVLAVTEPDAADENHIPLRDNLQRLRRMRLADGTPLRVLELPMPTPQFHEGQRLPASYANFYVANRVVLMPAFDDPEDAAAEAILAECFPGRTVVPLDCRKLVVGLGAFHCLTQQVPAVSVEGEG